VWADSTDLPFASTTSNQFLIRAEFTGINRSTPITPNEVFGVRAAVTNDYGGMYIETAGSGRPFYGYAMDGYGYAFTYLDGNDGNKWKLYNGGDHLTVAPSGNVGIGTVSPKQALHVNGDYYGKGHVWLHAFEGDALSGTAYLQARDDSGNSSIALQLRTQSNGNVVDALRIAPDGTVLVNGQICANNVNCTSDRNVKAGFQPVDSKAILEKVAALPITRWHYTNDNTATRHLGPVAQDFHAAFGVGSDDKYIATVDADGVALAAIQGLNQKLDEELKRSREKDAKISALEERLAKLEEILTANQR
jgi:hypothetical protein